MTPFVAESLTEHVTRILLPGNVYAFLAVGSERAALIDTGFGVGSLKSFVATLTDMPVTLILTHGHYDHVGGAGEFEHAHIHRNDIPLALAHGRKEMRAQALAGSGLALADDEIVGTLDASQLIPFESEWDYDLGGLTVRMLPLFGHTPGSCCPLFVEERLLLLGDACNSATYMQLDEATCLSAYRSSLDAFVQRYDSLYDHVIYSHPHNFGGKQIVREMVGLCDQVLTPGFEGTSLDVMLGPGILIAKPVDESFAPLDGSCANIVYRQDKVC